MYRELPYRPWWWCPCGIPSLECILYTNNQQLQCGSTNKISQFRNYHSLFTGVNAHVLLDTGVASGGELSIEGLCVDVGWGAKYLVAGFPQGCYLLPTKLPWVNHVLRVNQEHIVHMLYEPKMQT